MRSKMASSLAWTNSRASTSSRAVRYETHGAIWLCIMYYNCSLGRLGLHAMAHPVSVDSCIGNADLAFVQASRRQASKNCDVDAESMGVGMHNRVFNLIFC